MNFFQIQKKLKFTEILKKCTAISILKLTSSKFSNIEQNYIWYHSSKLFEVFQLLAENKHFGIFGNLKIFHKMWDLSNIRIFKNLFFQKKLKNFKNFGGVILCIIFLDTKIILKLSFFGICEIFRKLFSKLKLKNFKNVEAAKYKLNFFFLKFF